MDLPVIGLSILIAGFLGAFVHEVGHVIAARTFGLQVLSVRVGIGREIFSHTDGLGTRWTLGLLPLVGQCSFLEWAPAHARLPGLLNLSPLNRSIIYAAGPAANLATGFLLLFFLGRSNSFNFDLTAMQEFMLVIGGFSLLLGLFNLVPIPSLDGGRLLLVAVEVLSGSPIPRRREHSLSVAGRVFLKLASLVLSITLLSIYLDFRPFE